MASETSQRQAMRSTKRPTGKFSTMITYILGTLECPLGTSVPQTVAQSRANEFGNISQPLYKNKTKQANRVRPPLHKCAFTIAYHIECWHLTEQEQVHLALGRPVLYQYWIIHICS